MSTIKSYSLNLPVFERGHDLQRHLTADPQTNSDPVDPSVYSSALRAQMEQYRYAANLCGLLARVLETLNPHELAQITIEAGGHYIHVIGPDHLLDRYAQEPNGFLTPDNWDDSMLQMVAY